MHRYILIALLFTSGVVGCVQQQRQQHRYGRLMATAQAEEADKKALAQIREDLAKAEAEAIEIEKKNFRDACILRARAQHKACMDRNEVFGKSHSSMMKSMVDPTCNTVLDTSIRVCEKLTH